jgi:hypothetical protein
MKQDHGCGSHCVAEILNQVFLTVQTQNENRHLLPPRTKRLVGALIPIQGAAKSGLIRGGRQDK